MSDTLRARIGEEPITLGLILGSGLGAMADEMEDAVRVPFDEIEDFPVSTVGGHKGELVVGLLEGVRCAILSGRVHYYEAGNAAVMQPALELLKDLGADSLLLTNSAGSTRPEMPPGSLMAISDHINYSGLNPLMQWKTKDGQPEKDPFVGMVNAYDPGLRDRMVAAAESVGQNIYHGVYAWFSGPSFETPAEIRMIRMMGADAVGMSTAPETIMARKLGLKVAAVSCITNFGAGMTEGDNSHEETLDESKKARAKFIRLVRAYIGSFA
ncbi:purine-nucleoside phosphorylase [Pontivivens insulae]|uniref:Purine nucleoside phosphorylase n=1 Tax=Pontivivens insulae TaxID=1639689 RepID=A0A2R8ADL0_9RHOB|nr:purine-nucleoside phosphorylase [Pontivivens insulae]RED14266.1 purine-nucleoside phosphorylase [Pontivivens insulae]SPF30341.1 Purine nucleoside phosphorylase 1 [Pontivivens insulae]